MPGSNTSATVNNNYVAPHFVCSGACAHIYVCAHDPHVLIVHRAGAKRVSCRASLTLAAATATTTVYLASAFARMLVWGRHFFARAGRGACRL